MTQQFHPGQRWISDSEAELGLGTVLMCDGQRLTILYPATGETRLYSVRNAPLTRVRFAEGDEISHFDGWKMVVEDVKDIDELIIYLGTNEDGEMIELPETQLSNFIQFRLATDRLFAGQIDRRSWFSLRYRTLEHRSRQEQSSLWGLAGVRAQPISHQLHIAKEVADRIAPRVLLADEVGLGKTIEAGLIIHRQLMNGQAARVLIMVPETLQHQWLVEMRRRFNLQVTLFDQERFLASDADNPFEDCQLALLATNWISHDEEAQHALINAGWDLLVVDEAHHLTWSSTAASAEYQLVEQLAARISGVLLLTATPEQLGQESHFARLRLLDPHRFHDLQAFKQESEHYLPVADAVRELLEKGKLTQKAQKNILSFLGKDSAELVKTASEGDEAARKRLIRELIDRHGTGRLLFRNTRAAVQGFPERDLHPVALEIPEAYHEFNLNYPASLYPEVAYAEEYSRIEWWEFDPRVDWLIEKLKELKREKTLVICAHAQIALSLEEALRTREGIPATVFHEGMSIIERDRSAAWFAQEEDGAHVLICSEIGSEGRNFQFSHNLVLFDLPANPDLLEQRIGRLDRIGQKHRIQIHVPYFMDTAQERLFTWYDQALNAFTNTCPTGNALQANFIDELPAMLNSSLDMALIGKAQQARLDLEAQLQKGRDRLLELNSSGTGEGQALIDAINAQDQDFALPIYMEQLFNIYGIDSEDHSENAFILRPGEKMLDAAFPLGDDEATTITYDRELALSREDMQFLSWEHPMVQGGMDLVLSGSMGNTSVVLLKNKAIKQGTVLLELIFLSEALAPKHLQLGRYLPCNALRALLDNKGNDIAKHVAFETLHAQVENVAKVTATKFVRAQQTEILKLVAEAEAKMQPEHQSRIIQAKEAVQAELGEEIARLEALKLVNPSVRDDEINALKTRLSQALNALDSAVLRLDAIRILVAA